MPNDEAQSPLMTQFQYKAKKRSLVKMDRWSEHVVSFFLGAAIVGPHWYWWPCLGAFAFTLMVSISLGNLAVKRAEAEARACEEHEPICAECEEVISADIAAAGLYPCADGYREG